MLKLRLRYIFLIALMALAIEGSPKPYQEDTEDESEKSGFWTVFGMLVDYFYDDEEDYGDETDQYLICRNCTVVLNQNATQSGGGSETTTRPTSVPGPSTSTASTLSPEQSIGVSPEPGTEGAAGPTNGPPGTPGDTPAETPTETTAATPADTSSGGTPTDTPPGGTPTDTSTPENTPENTPASDPPAGGG